jgi:hypothetical protein
MTDGAAVPVLVAHRAAPMRRILRLNLEAVSVPAVEAASAAECLDWLRRHQGAAVVLDPDIFADPADEAAVSALLPALGLPVLVLSAAPEHRRLARALGDAPFCNRPDDVERVTSAVCSLLSGDRIPTLV